MGARGIYVDADDALSGLALKADIVLDREFDELPSHIQAELGFCLATPELATAFGVSEEEIFGLIAHLPWDEVIWCRCGSAHVTEAGAERLSLILCGRR
jgi:hypothetical protein